jgi:hypothetical protein
MKEMRMQLMRENVSIVIKKNFLRRPQKLFSAVHKKE